MKRHRALNYDMDFRAAQLSRQIDEAWEPNVQDLHRRNYEQTVQSFVREFGEWNLEAKLQNFIELGNGPFSVIAFHNTFFRQVRYAFVIGSYYPGLTGACALGERVLNLLVLNLREFYRSTPEYKKVYRKSSFDNWQLAIDTLETWGVLLPNAAANFRALARIRNQAIHFNPATDHNDRELALTAIRTLSQIIDEQFTVFGRRPWFIPGTPGVSFIRKESEIDPFVRTLYLPNCALVGSYHTLEFEATPDGTKCIVHDDYDYEPIEVSDEQFAELFNARR